MEVTVVLFWTHLPSPVGRQADERLFGFGPCVLVYSNHLAPPAATCDLLVDHTEKLISLLLPPGVLENVPSAHHEPCVSNNQVRPIILLKGFCSSDD